MKTAFPRERCDEGNSATIVASAFSVVCIVRFSQVVYDRVDGHGMNMEELKKNGRLDTKRVRWAGRPRECNLVLRW